MPTFAPEVLDKLRTYDTPTICNLIELFEVRPRTCGLYGCTYQGMFPGDAANGWFRRHGNLPCFLIPARVAMVMAACRHRSNALPIYLARRSWSFKILDEPSVAATFGELMCSTYQAFGAVGLITSGSGRDLAQVRAINFPVFTNGACCSHGYSHVIQVTHACPCWWHCHLIPTIYCIAIATASRQFLWRLPPQVADIGYEYVAAEAVILDALRVTAMSRQSPMLMHARKRKSAWKNCANKFRGRRK